MLKTCQKSLVLPMNNVSVCAFKTSPFVPAPRAHMFQHVCAWCRYKRGRFERTHGDVLSGHTEFFQCATPHHHTTATTPHNNTRRQRETETDRDRGRRQKEDRDRERIEDGRGETRQEKRRQKKRRQDNRREKIHFQCGGAWPFLVGGANRLVNFVDDGDLCLLYCVKYDSSLITWIYCSECPLPN